MYSGLESGSVGFLQRGVVLWRIWFEHQSVDAAVACDICKDMVLWLCLYPILFSKLLPFTQWHIRLNGAQKSSLRSSSLIASTDVRSRNRRAFNRAHAAASP